jgi:hypothetical protein
MSGLVAKEFCLLCVCVACMLFFFIHHRSYPPFILAEYISVLGLLLGKGFITSAINIFQFFFPGRNIQQ